MGLRHCQVSGREGGMACTQQAVLAWGLQHPLTSTLPFHPGRHRIHVCLSTVRYASTARTFGYSCRSYKSGSWNFREKSWCQVQVVWQSRGARGPRGAVVSGMGMTMAAVLSVVPWGWPCQCLSPHSISVGFVPQPLNADPTVPGSSALHLGRGQSSRDGLLGGWWVSKPRFVLFRWMWSGLGWQLGWIRLLKATLNITIGSFCFSLHISVRIDLPVA